MYRLARSILYDPLQHPISRCSDHTWVPGTKRSANLLPLLPSVSCSLSRPVPAFATRRFHQGAPGGATANQRSRERHSTDTTTTTTQHNSPQATLTPFDIVSTSSTPHPPPLPPFRLLLTSLTGTHSLVREH